jgi:hypothetical protein
MVLNPVGHVAGLLVVVYGRTTNTAVKKYDNICTLQRHTSMYTHFLLTKIQGIGGSISS